MRAKPFTLFFSVLIITLAITGCSNGSITSGSKDTSSAMQAVGTDTSAMKTDTSKMDTASTRPVKGPN